VGLGKPAVALLSGGPGSAMAAASARSEGFDLFALSIEYGQRHLVVKVDRRSEKRVEGRAGKNMEGENMGGKKRAFPSSFPRIL
jgi:hypothetical protein